MYKDRHWRSIKLLQVYKNILFFHSYFYSISFQFKLFTFHSLNWIDLVEEFWFIIFQICVLTWIGSLHGQNDLDFWNVERPKDMSNLASLEVMCGKTYMEVQVSFDRPFNGIIFSKGAVDQYNCIYVKPQTGSSSYSFNIMYDQVV